MQWPMHDALTEQVRLYHISKRIFNQRWLRLRRAEA